MKKLRFLLFVMALFQSSYSMNRQPTRQLAITAQIIFPGQGCDILCPQTCLGYQKSYDICTDNCYIYDDRFALDRQPRLPELACFCHIMSCCQQEDACRLCCRRKCLVSRRNDCGTCCGMQFAVLPCVASLECVVSVIKMISDACCSGCHKQNVPQEQTQSSNA